MVGSRNLRSRHPDSGRAYKSLVQLIDADTLKVRGFIGISLFAALDALRRNVDGLTGRALMPKAACQPRAANDCFRRGAALLTQGIHRPGRSRNFIQA
jgi:Uncharacterized protein conserved in bacteria (DUF2147)